MKRILRLAVLASLVGVVASAVAKNRDRLVELYKRYAGGRVTVDRSGPPPVAPGRYAPDVDFVGGQEDNLTTIRGIGPGTEKQLKAAGINTFEKLADLSGEQVMRVLTSAPPGADFDSWVAQAREAAEARRQG